MATDVGRSPDGSGYSAEPEPSFTVSAVPVSIPNASELWTQLLYPEAVEALAQGIGPLIVEEFDGEPFGAKWETISTKDKIALRFIAMRGLNRLMTHCHSKASAIEARRAETVQLGSVGDESAAPQEDAQTQSDEGMQ